MQDWRKIVAFWPHMADFRAGLRYMAAQFGVFCIQEWPAQPGNFSDKWPEIM
jgi:hypothetical protein